MILVDSADLYRFVEFLYIVLCCCLQLAHFAIEYSFRVIIYFFNVLNKVWVYFSWLVYILCTFIYEIHTDFKKQ